MENHVKRCWLTRGFKIIAANNIYASQIEHKFQKFSLAGDRSCGSSRLKINCDNTRASSERTNFLRFNGQNKFLIAARMTTDGEKGRLIFKHNFTELEGNVNYRRVFSFNWLNFSKSSFPIRYNLLHPQ